MKRKINKVHKRHGEPTRFASKLVNGEKLHTIRGNYDLWRVNADKMQTGKHVLSVRQWSGVSSAPSNNASVYQTPQPATAKDDDLPF